MNDDEVDTRFRALITEEFGEPDHAPTLPVWQSVVLPEEEQAPGPRDWVPPDEDEFGTEPVVEPPRPIGPLSTSTIMSLAGIAAGIVVGILILAQISLPGWAKWAGLIGFVVGAILAFRNLPKGPRKDDGAVV